ncbi:50S ribosomal protein L5 [Candidatus Saccharibacteria bacterium]|nr:50S ribosomal protein L5 [Candidatus Saccharibacteria bacterium]
MNRLMQKYNDTVINELKTDLAISNVHQIPRIQKIVINSGVGKAVADSKHLDMVVATLAKISGQKPINSKAKHSIASFKLREGMPIGTKVTLRGERMYSFLDRLIAVVLPRTRDFHGVSPKSFDASGNYSIGISDQTVFPEISYEDASAIHGLQITIVISGDDIKASKALLEKLGMPFMKGAK